jgi:hypothetical protein
VIGETVIVHHPATWATGGYGERTVATWDDEPIPGCAVAPGDTTENLDRQDTTDVAFTIYLPAGTVVEPEAQMTVREVRYEAEGKAEDWTNPYTDTARGVVAKVRRAQ